MINKAVLIGRVGKDVEKRETGSSMVANFSLATTKSWKDKEGNWQDKTTWHNIVAWGKTAEFCKVQKGDLVYIEGEIDNRSYDDKEGNKKYISEVNANVIRKVYTGEKTDTNQVQTVAAEVVQGSSDLPF